MSYSQLPQGANCRKLLFFARGLLFSCVSAGRDTKGGRKPGVPFRVKPQVFCLYALTVTKKLTGLREKANFKRSTVLFNMY